jgi:hypothetical protein
MPAGVRIPERIVVNVRIPVPGLGALALQGDDGIRLGEASQLGSLILTTPRSSRSGFGFSARVRAH